VFLDYTVLDESDVYYSINTMLTEQERMERERENTKEISIGIETQNKMDEKQ
jgi:hypothetical protein